MLSMEHNPLLPDETRGRTTALNLTKNLIRGHHGIAGSLAAYLVMLSIPLAMITIGSLHLHNCPLDKKIPIYLIVGGLLGVVDLFFFALTLPSERDEDETGSYKKCAGLMKTIGGLFLFAWLLAGSVWVYSVYEPNYDPSIAQLYCNKTVYLTAFVIISASWIPILFLALCGIAVAAFHTVCGRDNF